MIGEELYVRSSKKKDKLNGDDTSTNEDDVWDDTLLIEAYDKAVHVAHDEVLKTMQGSNKGSDGFFKNKKKQQWNIGDKCRCEYSEDHNCYEAEIIDIIDDLETCIVKYVGYENEEKVSLSKLKPSKGEGYRKMQAEQALLEKGKSYSSAERQSDSESYNYSRKKRSGKRQEKKNNKGSNLPPFDDHTNAFHSLRPPFMGSIPPPPPPHMFSQLEEDITESEALSAMLMSWYMSGYHTGYYQGLKASRKK